MNSVFPNFRLIAAPTLESFADSGCNNDLSNFGHNDCVESNYLTTLTLESLYRLICLTL